MTRIVNEAPKGELYGLPITGSTNSLAMFYNKDIFDKFGLPYPKDNMTWDDVYELTKKIGRTEGGGVYKGFTGLTPNILRYNQLGLPFIDPNADKIYDTEKWKAVFNNFLRFYELPNNPFGETLTDHYNDFGKKLNVAMHLSNHGDYRSFPDKMNWDIMAIPAMKGIAPNSGGVGAAYWAITQQAPDKELAFRVISYLLSEEVQIANARLGYIPSVVDQKIFDSFGLDDPKLQGKNRKAFFAHPYAPAPAKRNPSLIRFNESDQANIFRDVLANVAQNKTDINTALREATELIDKKFKEAAAK
jgi:multiple sugar transport system substrate-binding protein